jgi:tetratricopeptide (TPR) repeat protein
MVRSRFPAWLLAVLLVLATVALYWPAMRCGFINLDDPDCVTENHHIQGGLTWEGVKWAFSDTEQHAYWAPLTWLSHEVACQFFGLNPWGHHLINVLLHAANTALVFLVFRRLTGATWRSLMLAALFGWHPLRVESVAWVTERADVLSTLFWMLALLAYASYAQKSEVRGQKSGTNLPNPKSFLLVPFYWLSLFFFALGLMSKAMLVTMPFVLLLLDWWPLERLRSGSVWRLVREKIPFFALASVMSVVTFMAQKQGGAVRSVEYLPLGARVGNALISYCRYLGKMFWPTDLAVFYPHPWYWPLGKVLLAGMILSSISVLLFVKRSRYPYSLMGWLWFVGTLVPVIGLVQVGLQAMADRYSYVPSIGLFIFLSWGAGALTKGWRHRVIVLSGAATVAMALCAGLAWRQVGYWKDTRTLFQHAIDATKNNFIAYSNLGDYELEQGNYDEAIKLCGEATRLMPSYHLAYSPLGAALCKSGRLTEGIQELQLAVKMDPDTAQPHSDMADALVQKGQGADAINEYRETIRLNPEMLDARNRLGVLLENSGHLDEAIQQFEEVIRINPAYVSAYNNLGLALESQGRLNQAFAEFKMAVRLDPHDAKGHFGLSLALKVKGRLDEAIGEFEEGLKLEPDTPQAHNELGVMLGQKGRWDEAITQFQEAVRLKPDYDEAKHNLSSALKKKATPVKP